MFSNPNPQETRYLTMVVTKKKTNENQESDSNNILLFNHGRIKGANLIMGDNMDSNGWGKCCLWTMRFRHAWTWCAKWEHKNMNKPWIHAFSPCCPEACMGHHPPNRSCPAPSHAPAPLPVTWRRLRQRADSALMFFRKLNYIPVSTVVTMIYLCFLCFFFCWMLHAST